MTDNTTAKKKGQRDKQRFTKTLHRKLKIIFIFIFYDGKMDTMESVYSESKKF